MENSFAVYHQNFHMFKGFYSTVKNLVVFSGVIICFAQTLSAQDSLRSIHPRANRSFDLRKLVIPTSLIGIGATSTTGKYIISNPEIKEERDEHFAKFHTRIDNMLQFAPIAAGYGMLLNNHQHQFWPYTKKVILNEALLIAMVFPTKKIVGKPRPDTGTPNSFPSGHTAQAFSGATLFCDEFAQHNFWLKTTVYGGASAVGALRILNNRHWTGDVIAGAGFGILSAKLSEWIVEPHGRKAEQKVVL